MYGTFKEVYIMNKKVLKFITIVLMASLVIAAFVSPALARDPKSINTNDYVAEQDQTGAASSAQRIVGTLIDVFQVVGVGVAIIMLVMLAIKYLSAAPNEKAEIKKSVSIYVLGAVLLFAAAGVLEIVQAFSKNVKGNSSGSGSAGAGGNT